MKINRMRSGKKKIHLTSIKFLMVEKNNFSVRKSCKIFFIFEGRQKINFQYFWTVYDFNKNFS